MKDPGKGILLSALVFPGSGQMYLGRRRRGILFALFALLCSAGLVAIIASGTWHGMETMAENGEEIGPSALFDSALLGLREGETYALPPLVLCWLFSLADTIRLVRLSDAVQGVKKNDQVSDQGV